MEPRFSVASGFFNSCVIGLCLIFRFKSDGFISLTNNLVKSQGYFGHCIGLFFFGQERSYIDVIDNPRLGGKEVRVLSPLVSNPEEGRCNIETCGERVG